jgi:hypothetical protein
VAWCPLEQTQEGVGDAHASVYTTCVRSVNRHRRPVHSETAGGHHLPGRDGRVADAEALADRLRARVGTGGAALLSAAMARAYTEQTDPEGVLRHCDAVRHEPSLSPGLRAGLLPYGGSRRSWPDGSRRPRLRLGAPSKPENATPPRSPSSLVGACCASVRSPRAEVGTPPPWRPTTPRRGPPTTGPSSSR